MATPQTTSEWKTIVQEKKQLPFLHLNSARVRSPFVPLKAEQSGFSGYKHFEAPFPHPFDPPVACFSSTLQSASKTTKSATSVVAALGGGGKKGEGGERRNGEFCFASPFIIIRPSHRPDSDPRRWNPLMSPDARERRQRRRGTRETQGRSD